MSTTAADTLTLLERRVARLEFQLGTDAREDAQGQELNVSPPEESVVAHLTRLEERLKELCAKNRQVAAVLKLYDRNAELAHLVESCQDETSTRPGDDQTARVLSTASLFPQAVSDLSSLQGQHVPDARQLATLVSLQPRIARALAIQLVQSEQQDELHLRSARLLSRWYEKSVIRDGEQWADWEERLSQAEMRLRRKENAKRREDEGL